MTKIGFGGGCHWCTEAVFQSLSGVGRVEQGFIRSHAPADSWSEAVVVHFDPMQIDLTTLLEIHIRTHSAASDHSMRDKYRSAVYVFDEQQKCAANAAITRLQADFDGKLVTRVLWFVAFRASDVRCQNYYQSNPDRPFCKRYIDPKLDLIRRQFASKVRP